MNAPKLYVGNLNFKTTESELADYFGQCGKVEEAIIIKDRETGRTKGFGFVTFDTIDNANKAINELHGREFAGRPLTVNEAREQKERPPRRSY